MTASDYRLPANPPDRRRTLRFGVAALLSLLCFAPQPLAAQSTEQTVRNPFSPFRVGYSARVFPGINENDAKAATRLWSQTIGREQNIPVDPSPVTLNSNAAIVEAIREGTIDAATLLIDEYWAIRKQVPLGPFVLGLNQHVATEQFLLLVHADRPFHSLTDLRNCTVTVMRDGRSAIGNIWLDTQLLAQGLGPTDRFWSRSTEVNGASKTVLPVFFNQSDACLTTRKAFQTMSELNPQVGRKLRVIAESPALIPVVFCFGRNIDPELLRRLRLAIPSIRSSVAGRQIMTLFQCDEVVNSSESDLESTCELLDQHEALKLAAPKGGGS